jgi:hypothetical protein
MSKLKEGMLWAEIEVAFCPLTGADEDIKAHHCEEGCGDGGKEGIHSGSFSG